MVTGNGPTLLLHALLLAAGTSNRQEPSNNLQCLQQGDDLILMPLAHPFMNG